MANEKTLPTLEEIESLEAFLRGDGFYAAVSGKKLRNLCHAAREALRLTAKPNQRELQTGERICQRCGLRVEPHRCGDGNALKF